MANESKFEIKQKTCPNCRMLCEYKIYKNGGYSFSCKLCHCGGAGGFEKGGGGGGKDYGETGSYEARGSLE